MACNVPIVETERLILRAGRVEDFPAYAEMWARPDVARYITGKPLSREEAWSKFGRMAGLWALTGYGFWAIEEKASGAFIGEAGVADFRRDMEPSLDGKPEFGWGLVPSMQGKGYATEAVLAGLRWAAQSLNARTYCCIISPRNVASIRVAERCGFVKSAETTYKGEASIIYERPAPQR
jgi:RimJ/RimL family protein N-acetyltransferase